MEYPFDALHAGIESQILNLPANIPDSQAVTQAKALPKIGARKSALAPTTGGTVSDDTAK